MNINQAREQPRTYANEANMCAVDTTLELMLTVFNNRVETIRKCALLSALLTIVQLMHACRGAFRPFISFLKPISPLPTLQCQSTSKQGDVLDIFGEIGGFS